MEPPPHICNRCVSTPPPNGSSPDQSILPEFDGEVKPQSSLTQPAKGEGGGACVVCPRWGQIMREGRAGHPRGGAGPGGAEATPPSPPPAGEGGGLGWGPIPSPRDDRKK